MAYGRCDIVIPILNAAKEKNDFTYPGMSQTDLTYDYGNATLGHMVDLCVTSHPILHKSFVDFSFHK